MANKKVKKSANQIAYKKELSRIKRGIKQAEKRGYFVDSSLIPEMPKRVTKKALEKIKQIKPKDIYSQGEWLDISTGELVPAKQRIEEVKIQSALKRKHTIESKKYPVKDIITTINDRIVDMSNVVSIRNTISDMERKNNAKYPLKARNNALLSILDDTLLLNDGNEEAVVKHLLKYEEEIFTLIDKIQYDSDTPDGKGTLSSYARLGSILNMGALSPLQAEALHDMSESWEDVY